MTTPTPTIDAVQMPPLPVVAYRYKNNRGNGEFAYVLHLPEEEPGAYRDNCLEIDRLCKVSDAQAYAAQQAVAVPAIPYKEIAGILGEVMEIAVSNGANSISMPDDYVAVAYWLNSQKLAAAPTTTEGS